MHSSGEGLYCEACGLVYPLRDGIPIMLEEEAIPVQKGGVVSAKSRKIVEFDITEGRNKGQKLKLPVGTCKAIGRSIEDNTKTQVFSMDFTTSLDDFTKKVVMNYISQRTKGSSETGALEGEKDRIGAFKRLPDLILNDPAISRLHAMIFHDDHGAGILDLVSKNGTFVNGVEVESVSLKPGDVVEVGSSKFVVGVKE